MLVFGAPASLLSLLLAIAGIWKRWIPLIIISGIWAIPATYYMSTVLRFPVFVAAIFVFGAAYAVHKEKIRTAYLLLIPLLLVATWMTVFTIHNILIG